MEELFMMLMFDEKKMSLGILIIITFFNHSVIISINEIHYLTCYLEKNVLNIVWDCHKTILINTILIQL